MKFFPLLLLALIVFCLNENNWYERILERLEDVLYRDSKPIINPNWVSRSGTQFQIYKWCYYKIWYSIKRVTIRNFV